MVYKNINSDACKANCKSGKVNILGLLLPTVPSGILRKKVCKLASGENGYGNTVFTPNASIALTCHQNSGLRALVSKADLLLPDGSGIILASRILKNPIPERTTGIDTAEWLLSYAAQKDLSVYLLGARDGIAQMAGENLQKKFPALKIAGVHHGYFNKEKTSRENREVIRKIKSVKPDLLFVCFGFPEQEKWISSNLSSLPSVRLCMGLGGSLDVWAGKTRRAPQWMQKTGCEWLWRALCSPAHLNRIAGIPCFLWKVVRQRAEKKFS